MPTLTPDEIRRGRLMTRPRSILVDSATGEAVKDPVSLEGDSICFHLGPACEVTTCLSQALQDVMAIQQRLGCGLADIRLKAQLMTDPRDVNRGRVA